MLVLVSLQIGILSLVCSTFQRFIVVVHLYLVQQWCNIHRLLNTLASMECVLCLGNLFTIETSDILGTLVRLDRAAIVYDVYLVLHHNFSFLISLEAI